MKFIKRLTPLLLVLFSVVSCMPEDADPSLENANLPLVSAKGVVLADNMSQLVSKIRNLGDIAPAAQIWITSIEYLETEIQTVAFIQWMNESGNLDGMALTLKNEGVGKDEVDQRVENMKWRITCEGPCGCLERGTINPDQTVTVECSCEECAMDIKQVE